jgi:hypothetical protein
MTLDQETLLNYRLAIVKSRRYQYEIAAAADLSEHKLSMFLCGRLNLRPDELEHLEAVLGIAREADVSA